MLTRTSILLALLLAPQLALAAVNDDWEIGIKCLRRRQFHLACRKFDQIIQQNPKLAIAYLKRAESLVGCRRYADALEDFNEAIRLDPKMADAYYARGWLNWKYCHHQKMIEDLKRAFQLKPDNAYILRDLARLHGEMGEFSQEFEYWTRLTKVPNPGYQFEGYTGRLLIHILFGRFKEAIADCNEADRVSPGTGWIYHLRGFCNHRLMNYKKAIEDYLKAIKLNPNDAIDQCNLGLAYYDMGDYEKAVKQYTKCLAFTYELDTVYANRALAFAKLGNDKKAKEDFELSLHMRKLHISGSKPDISAEKSMHDYRPTPLFRSGSGKEDFDWTSFHVLPSEEQKNVANYDQLIKLDPRDVDSYFHRGTAQFCLGRTQEGVKDLSVFLDRCSWEGTAPLHAAALLHLGLRKLGKTAEARAALLRATREAKLNTWPRALLSYHLKIIPARDLYEQARTRQALTTAKYHVGMDLLLSGFEKDGLAELRWIGGHGDRGMDEHFLAVRAIEEFTAHKGKKAISGALRN
ncbi:MAG TPA: tetratricopeptide repeat protein [Candidatus Obscuribacterales bacterium]